MSLESEYQLWLGMAFRGQKLVKVQVDAMRDAFFAGALTAKVMDPAEVYDEVKRHVDSLDPKRN